MSLYASGHTTSHDDSTTLRIGSVIELLASGDRRQLVRHVLVDLSHHLGGRAAAVLMADPSNTQLLPADDIGYGSALSEVIVATSGVSNDLTRAVLAGHVWRKPRTRPSRQSSGVTHLGDHGPSGPIDLAVPITVPRGSGAPAHVWGCVVIGTATQQVTGPPIDIVRAAAQIIGLYLEAEVDRERQEPLGSAGEEAHPASANIEADDLIAALKDGRIRPWYQPLFDLESRTTVAVEALARWVEPDGSIVTPGEFIPSIEAHGLMSRLTATMFRQVVSDVARWNSLGVLPEDFKASVNVSTSDLTGGMLPAIVSSLLVEHHVDPSMLCLELTETEAMVDIEHSLAMLRQLRELGVSLSIDDFGTGYSSLSYLTQLPVEIVKIDRAFVTGLFTRRGDDAIIGAVVDVADAVGLTVLAEGIETEEELQRLRELGVKLGQGFLVSPAIKAEALVHHLAAHT